MKQGIIVAGGATPQIVKLKGSFILEELSLEGAIQGVKKTELPQERKADLKDFYNWHKGKYISNLIYFRVECFK